MNFHSVVCSSGVVVVSIIKINKIFTDSAFEVACLANSS